MICRDKLSLTVVIVARHRQRSPQIPSVVILVASRVKAHRVAGVFDHRFDAPFFSTDLTVAPLYLHREQFFSIEPRLMENKKVGSSALRCTTPFTKLASCRIGSMTR
jgi:hypothetical protein